MEEEQTIYYIYHIPGKKIGVTRDLNKRVTFVQGYKEGEYEVLDQSTDIDYISRREVELQTFHGYDRETILYKNLKFNKNKMKKTKNQFNVNPTEATSTFPVPIKGLSEYLNKFKNEAWETAQGYFFTLNDTTINWILSNAQVSKFNSNRTYIYNKALYEYLRSLSGDSDRYTTSTTDNDDNIYMRRGIITTDSYNTTCRPINDNDFIRFEAIREWARERGIYSKGDSKTQYVKLIEEAGELAKALLKNDKPEIKDAIGDMIVVLTNLAHLEGFEVEDCIDAAYNVIAKRKGSMVNGTFVKETL